MSVPSRTVDGVACYPFDLVTASIGVRVLFPFLKAPGLAVGSVLERSSNVFFIKRERRRGHSITRILETKFFPTDGTAASKFPTFLLRAGVLRLFQIGIHLWFGKTKSFRVLIPFSAVILRQGKKLVLLGVVF